MALVEINWKPDSTELRKFGVAMIVGFAIIGGVFYWRGHAQIAYGCFIFGATAGALGLSGLKIALPVYWAWMSIAFVMGNVMGRVILGAVFYLLITPIGIMRKLAGADPLRLKRPKTDSYWLDHEAPDEPESYEKQF